MWRVSDGSVKKVKKFNKYYGKKKYEINKPFQRVMISQSWSFANEGNNINKTLTLTIHVILHEVGLVQFV